MWHDNETARDFLNFSGVSATVAELIRQSNGQPISIGVSGIWGVGKSSMIKLIRASLEEQRDSKFIFVEFNAWLYQGYDDARAALMDVIAEKLHSEAELKKTGIAKTTELLSRINWLRLGKVAGGSVASIALGLPPVGLIASLADFGMKSIAGEATSKQLEGVQSDAAKAADDLTHLLKAKPQFSPPKEIQALRNCFEEALEELGLTLVVLIDDLDRCLPETTISTLEAIRLFLFLKNTAFVIAADNDMIKNAVRQHFVGVDESLVTSYFDKLIQIPIRVPPLGTQEVRAYLLLLYVENSNLSPVEKEHIRSKVIGQLAQSWRGSRVDRAFMGTLGIEYPSELAAQFEAADRMAPIMTTATQIAGNPRLIKRFLNAISIRMSISNAQHVGVDESVLAKMLLFERCGDAACYDLIVKAVNSSDDGKPQFLRDWETAANAGEPFDLSNPWDTVFFREWLTLSPSLHGQDLRGVLYVSREHRPLVTPEDRLSSNGAELLSAFLTEPSMAETLKSRLVGLARSDLDLMMDRVLKRAQQEQEWGTPPILTACMALASSDLSLGKRLASFLGERPPAQIKANIIPKIASESWAKDLLEGWKHKPVSAPVKRAITMSENNGDF